jgi:hypothetical protein
MLGHHAVTISAFRHSSSQFIRVSFHSHPANPTNTKRARSIAYWSEICDILIEYLDSVIFCLPRLGSGVRIASPAPELLKEISDFNYARKGAVGVGAILAAKCRGVI